MLETSARLLRLLSLFQQRRYWSGFDLAGRLEVTTRTLRRDVDKLRSLGYPIHSTSGTEGGYQLGSGSEMPPLLLDDEEVVAVSIGLHSAATGTVTGIHEASIRALAKIEQMLPARLARRVGALHATIVTAGRRRDAKVDAGTLSAIAAACRDCESIRFPYRSHSGVETTRSVEPCRLVYTGYQWYLVAWDWARQDWRTFRVDRIAKVTAGSRFEPRKAPAEDLAAYVSNGAWQAPPSRARVRLRVSAETLGEDFPPWIGTLEPVDSGSCFLNLGASTYENAALHLLMLGVDFEVPESIELVDQLRALKNRLSRGLS